MSGSPRSRMADADPVMDAVAGIRQHRSPGLWATRFVARFDLFDIATVVLLAAVTVIALCTFRDYAISNDEGVQHRYGELIIAYYASGFRDRASSISRTSISMAACSTSLPSRSAICVPIDPYDLRHILCALIGIGGIGAAAATARLIAGPRAALIAAIALERLRRVVRRHVQPHQGHSVCRRDDGRDVVLIRIARRLPSPRARRHRGVRAPDRGRARHAGARSAAGDLHRLCDRAVFAAAMAATRPRAPALRDRLSGLRMLPALGLAYVIMILAWPWAALAPLNPIRGLLAFSEFHYAIRTVLAGKVYEMAERAAAVCADLLSDPRAAADAVRRGTGDAVAAAAVWRAGAARRRIAGISRWSR